MPSTPDFIRVGGVLYRARRPSPPPEFLKYAGATYRLAALPQVQSHAVTYVDTLQRILHEAGVGDLVIQQLTALKEAVLARKHRIAHGIWSSIRPGIMDALAQLQGDQRAKFGKDALALDEFLSSLPKAES